MLKEDTLRTPPDRVPCTISVEPPPTSTTATSPARDMSRGPHRPDEGEPPLLLLAQYLDRQAAGARHLVDHLLAVGGLPHCGCRDDADRVGIELLGEPHLRRDGLRDLLHLLGADRPVGSRGLAEPRERLLVHHSAQLTLLRLGHEHARGVRADVDRCAEHGEPSCQRCQTATRRGLQ